VSALRIGLVVVLAVAATVVANVVLLGVATGSDNVGKLVPSAALITTPAPKPPAQTRPAPPRVEPGEHSDD
jgi:hypothetical protein